ncbi:PPM1J family protein [Megaselia abdita]
MSSLYANLKRRVDSVVNPSILSLESFASPILPTSSGGRGSLRPKFQYSRPVFLQLWTSDELRASADHNVRPIIVPRDIDVLPFQTGYAECVNSGKSEWNEDQAGFCRKVLSHPSEPFTELPYTYFGIFDGHAGVGAALAAANQFHHILHEKLVDIIEMLLPDSDNIPTEKKSMIFQYPLSFQKTVTKEELIIGALESAFAEMDAMLAEDRTKYRNAGGCTALVTLFIGGKMYVSNAGDSRAVLCQRKDGVAFPTPFSFDHTPDTERERLMTTGKLNPALMANDYVAMEYTKRPSKRDLGQRTLYKEGSMKGWAYKTLTPNDLKMPLVTGNGKRSRLLGTIGVTRGFGDHDLRALGSGILIKPFLSCHPEVISRDLTTVVSIPDENNEDGDYGVLIMATDGLWDVADPEAVSNTVFKTLDKYPTEKHRYTMVAQELVAKSRGRVNSSGHWRLADVEAAATVDDISVICIPVYQYYKQWVEWEKENQEKKRKHEEELQNRTESMSSVEIALDDTDEVALSDSLKETNLEETPDEKTTKENEDIPERTEEDTKEDTKPAKKKGKGKKGSSSSSSSTC